MMKIIRKMILLLIFWLLPSFGYSEIAKLTEAKIVAEHWIQFILQRDDSAIDWERSLILLGRRKQHLPARPVFSAPNRVLSRTAA